MFHKHLVFTQNNITTKSKKHMYIKLIQTIKELFVISTILVKIRNW